MSNELQDIVDQIAILQKAVPVPTGEKDITHAYDEQPESAATFPCFINIVRDVGEFKRQSAARQQGSLAIDMYLCFEQGSGIYADRSRRLWYQAVMDYFDQHQGLGNTVHMAAIERAAFDEPYLAGGSDQSTSGLRYPGIKFELKALMKASAVTLAMDGAAAYDPACTLTSGLISTTTTVTYTSTGDPIAQFDVVQIDSELIIIANILPASNALWLGRGYGGTTAASHSAGAAILKWGQV